MLIYLDHAHLVALERLMKRDRDAFIGFLERWMARKCQLVVSRAHLHEIGQSEDELDVESKLELLRYFSLRSGPVDENVDWVIIREIRHQTLGRLAQGADAPPSDYRRVRDELYRPADHEGMRQFVRWARPGWLDELATIGRWQSCSRHTCASGLSVPRRSTRWSDGSTPSQKRGRRRRTGRG